MADLEPTGDCLKEDGVLIPNLSRMVIGGDINPRWTDLNRTAFDFSCIPIVVRPYFKVVRDPGVFRAKVIKQDGLALFVAIPPFVKALVIERRIL